MHWIIRFSLGCAALIVLGLMVIWAFDGFRSFGIEGHVAVAMFLGIFFTILVSVVLMALIFYSNRGGYDAAAHDFSQSDPARPEAGKSDRDGSASGE